MMQQARGFALITVLCVVLIVSAVALSLASAMRLEARGVAGERDALQAAQLCVAGQEMASYLVARGLGTPLENLEGLPVEPVEPGFHYVLHLPAGDVELFLEAEDGKLNLSSAPPELLEGFFTSWAGDSARARQLVDAVVDWRDLDDVPESEGAERDVYLPLGYVTRNRQLGAGDAMLLRGLAPDDFRDRVFAEIVDGTRQWRRRAGLQDLLTNEPVGSTVNPNFASEFVLRSVPGFAPYAERTVAERQMALFTGVPDFLLRVGVGGDSPILNFLHFNRRVPVVLTVSYASDRRIVRSERRVMVKGSAVFVEHNVLPEYARGRGGSG